MKLHRLFFCLLALSLLVFPAAAQNGTQEELLEHLYYTGLNCQENPEKIVDLDFDRLVSSRDTVVLLNLLEMLSWVDPATVSERIMDDYYVPYLKRTIVELAGTKAELKALAHGRKVSLKTRFDLSFQIFNLPADRWELGSLVRLGKVLTNHFYSQISETGRSARYRSYNPRPALHYLEAALYGDDKYVSKLPGETMTREEKKALREYAGFASGADYFGIAEAVDRQLGKDYFQKDTSRLFRFGDVFSSYYDRFRPEGFGLFVLLGASASANPELFKFYQEVMFKDGRSVDPVLQVEMDHIRELAQPFRSGENGKFQNYFEKYPFPQDCWREHQEDPQFKEYFQAHVLMDVALLKGYLMLAPQSDQMAGFLKEALFTEYIEPLGYSSFSEYALASVGTGTQYWHFTKEVMGLELMEIGIEFTSMLNLVPIGNMIEAASVYMSLGMLQSSRWLLESLILPNLGPDLEVQEGMDEWTRGSQMFTVVNTMNLMALCDREAYQASLDELESWFEEQFRQLTSREYRDEFSLYYANYLESDGKSERSLKVLEKAGIQNPDYRPMEELISFMDWSALGDYGKAAQYMGQFREEGLSDWDFDVIGRVVDVAARITDPLLPKYAESFHDRMDWLLRSNFLTSRDTDRSDMAETLWKSALPLVRALAGIPAGSMPHTSLSGLLYDWSLLSKGLLLEADHSLEAGLMNSPDQHIRDIFGMLKYWARAYDNNLLEGASEEDLAFCSSAYAYYQRSVQTYMRSNPLLKEFGDHISIRWTDVQRRLGPTEAAVEFVGYEQDGEQRYMALVVRNTGDPTAVSVCSEGEVRNIMRRLSENRLYSNAFASKQLYGLVWNPLEAYLEGVQDVYFAADGLFHQMNLEALQDGSGQLACARWNLYRVSSTRELCKDFRHRSPMRKAVLYGGLDYALEGALAPEIEARYADMHSSGTRGTMVPGQVPVTSLSAETLPEVESIRASLAPAGVDSRILTGADGMEESFKQLSGTGVNLIHMATHGFFFDGIVEYQGNKEEVLPPMLRSGLVMSRFPEPKDGFDDGYLLASEIAELDLSSVGLFVMSACETGKGDVSGEGVFGLQRGLKQAGVGSIIMTLWKVNSEVAQRFMTTFYSCLGRGADRYAAFREARSETRNAFPTSDWSAFILLD